MPRYRVDLYGFAEVRRTVYIEAASADTAKAEARKTTGRRVGAWDVNDESDVENVHVDDAEEVDAP